MNQSYIGLQLTGYQGQSIEIVSFFEKFNMYQAKETSTNGVVTSPLFTAEDIETFISRQSDITGSIKQMEEVNTAQLEEQRQQELAESIGDFLIDNPKQHARAKATLNKSVKYDGVWTTRKEYAEKLAASNENIEIVVIKGKYHYRFVDESAVLEITKTEADYYAYLLSVKELTTTESIQTSARESTITEEETLIETYTTKQYTIKLFSLIDKHKEILLGEVVYNYHLIITDNATGLINHELSDFVYLSLESALKEIKLHATELSDDKKELIQDIRIGVI